MNILYIKLRHGFYGGEKQTEELVRGLQKRGHKLFLITLPNSDIGKKLHDVPQASFNIFPYPDKRTKSLVFLFFLPYFYVKFYYLAKRFTKQNNIELVCLQEPYERIVCGPIFKLLKVKVTWLEILYWEPFLKNIFIVFYLMLYSLKFCDGIILSSDFLKRQTKPYIKNTKTVVIKHALKKEDQKKFIDIATNHYPIKNIGFIGSIAKVKGVFVLLKAFKQLVQQGYNLKLLYAGGGEALDELKDKIKQEKIGNYVKTLGKQKAINFYQKIDLLVVPSYFDNLPYVVQEAFCANVPVIGSKTGGIPEYFPGKAKKWLFKSGDKDELFSKIDNAINLSEKDVTQIVNHNFKFYQKNFNFEKMLDQTEKFFQNL